MRTGLTFPGGFAMVMQAHMARYGTTREQVAAVSVKNHANGAANPKAQFKKPTTIGQVVNSRFVAEPLRLFDCPPISDGAAAAVVCTAAIARQYTKRGVRILGSGHGSGPVALTGMDDLTSFPGHGARGSGGVRPGRNRPRRGGCRRGARLLHDCGVGGDGGPRSGAARRERSSGGSRQDRYCRAGCRSIPAADSSPRATRWEPAARGRSTISRCSCAARLAIRSPAPALVWPTAWAAAVRRRRSTSWPVTDSPVLTAYRCRQDGRLVMTRGDACPTCGRTGLEPHEVAGEGRVVVWTTIHVPPTRYAAEAPYTVAMVELDGGLRTMGRLLGGAGRALGARVRLHHVDLQRGPIFAAADPAHAIGITD